MHALTCTISRDGLNAVITLTGELDMASQPLLLGTVASCIAYGATLTMECSGVSFMDSGGMQTLLRLRRIAKDSGAIFEIAAPPPAITRVLTLTGLTPFFTITSAQPRRPDNPRRADGHHAELSAARNLNPKPHAHTHDGAAAEPSTIPAPPQGVTCLCH